jgi:transposase
MKSHGAFFQGYNCQAVVDGQCQVVVAAMVGNSPVDYDMLLPMVEETRRVNGVLPGKVLADAGYFSFDNLEKASILGVDAYIPDQMYHNKNKHDGDKPDDGKKKKMYGKDMFNYDPVGDVYVCPSGRMLSFSHVSPNNGVDYRVYFCRDCMGCPCKKECTSAENRRVTRNPREHFWEAMRAKLGTVEGKKTYAKRMCTVEPVFGNIKKNHGFTEFTLRGLAKAGIEFLLACTVHNLGKMTLQKLKQTLETIRTKTPSLKTAPYSSPRMNTYTIPA